MVDILDTAVIHCWCPVGSTIWRSHCRAHPWTWRCPCLSLYHTRRAHFLRSLSNHFHVIFFSFLGCSFSPVTRALLLLPPPPMPPLQPLALDFRNFKLCIIYLCFIIHHPFWVAERWRRWFYYYSSWLEALGFTSDVFCFCVWWHL